MNKKFGTLIVLLAGAVLIWGLVAFAESIIIKYKGTPITATVIKVDTDCDKYNHIEVLYESRPYEVSIGRESCRKGVYKIGQQVTLLKHSDYNELIWPESKPEWVLLFIVGLVTYSITSALRKTREAKYTRNRGKRKPNTALYKSGF